MVSTSSTRTILALLVGEPVLKKSGDCRIPAVLITLNRWGRQVSSLLGTFFRLDVHADLPQQQSFLFHPSSKAIFQGEGQRSTVCPLRRRRQRLLGTGISTGGGSVTESVPFGFGPIPLSAIALDRVLWQDRGDHHAWPSGSSVEEFHAMGSQKQNGRRWGH